MQLKYETTMFAIGESNMPHKRWHVSILPLVFVISLVLTACGSAGSQDPAVSTLTYAVLGEGALVKAQGMVKEFNKSHQDIKVEVKEYLNEDGRSGKERLFVEIASGKIPDIIDLGSDAETSSMLPYHLLATEGYLENLWPYIENDPDLGRDGVMEAPLKAAEVNGGLYTVFGGVHIETLAGAENLIGDRKSWTLAQLQEVFASMPEDSTVLAYCTEKQGAFDNIFRHSLENYVDRDSGTCDFTNENFRSSLEFVNSFPFKFTGLRENINTEVAERVFSGRQMLEKAYLGSPLSIQQYDAFYGSGGRVAFIGFPTEDGSAGSTFQVSTRPLAMSSVCQNKEAAWEFLREVLLPQYDNMDDMIDDNAFYSTPVNQSDYNMMIKCVMTRDVWEQINVLGFPTLEIHHSTQEEVDRFEDLFNSIETINLYDPTVYDIVYEACGPYFAGDKTIDETITRIQNRVSLYLNELQ